MQAQQLFKILVLDGGGSKGIYTIGILKELEKKLGGSLHEHFQLIYGTSTGAIIGSFIALGKKMDEIVELYMNLIPKIMNGASKVDRSAILKKEADEVFSKQKFDAFKTDIGIVSLNYEDKRPLIFKSNVQFAHGLQGTFVAGFGCSISDAIQASCSAYPIFDIKEIQTNNQGTIKAIDGGFIANNATLFALVDAHKAFGMPEENIRVLSLGVGNFVEKPINFQLSLLGKLKFVKLVDKVLGSNTNTNELLVKLLFPALKIVRVSDTFNQPEYGTNMMEMKKEKLDRMLQLGRISFGKYEKDINELFNH